MLLRLASNFHRLFWSIYFVLGIAIVGAICGYFLTTVLFLSARGFRHFKTTQALAERLSILAELTLASAIRFLLQIQPWVRCQTNFRPIRHFFDPFPSRRILFVGNHRSNMDTFLLISYIPGLRGLAKSSLYNNFFFAPVMHMMGFVPVDKGSMSSFMGGLHLLRDQVFAKDLPVLMFPENTRRERGLPSLDKFSVGGFQMAMEANALIVPIALKNTDQLMGKGDLLIRLFAPIEIKQLPAVEPRKFKDAFALRDFVHASLEAELA